jgi:pyrroline-5-carboxylate reductase
MRYSEGDNFNLTTANEKHVSINKKRTVFMLDCKKIVVIGVGKIGEAVVSGLINQGDVKESAITGTVRHASSKERVQQKLNIEMLLDNKKAVEGKDIVLLAIKPQNMAAVMDEIAPSLLSSQLLISIAASVSTAFIEGRLKNPMPVIRAMPNTPALLNVGMTGLCSGSYAQKEHMHLAELIFKSVGQTVIIEEELMDGVTALSASGPAYLYVVIESLAEAGVKLGIPRDISTLLVAQTMLGAAKMVLSSKAHPALLKDTVTTPAGCTIDGLMELEEGKLRVTLIKAVLKSAERARELVNNQNSQK